MDRRRKAQRPHSQSQHTGQEGTNPKVGSKDSVSAPCVSISASNHRPSCKSKLGKQEACSGSPQTPLSLGKSQEVLSKCRSCWLQLVWSPLCLKAGASEAQASIFFHFHKSSFPSIYWMCCVWYWVGTQAVSNCRSVTPLPSSEGPRFPL